jgi:ABC-type transport system involved in cytochrome bd biosynthesis fused ATPase/permease subunit
MLGVRIRIRTIMLAVLYAAVFMGIYMAVMRSPLFSENPFHDTYPVFLMMLVYLISFPIIAFLAFLATALLVSAVQFAVSRDIFRSIRRRGGRRSRRADGSDPRPEVDQSGALKRV